MSQKWGLAFAGACCVVLGNGCDDTHQAHNATNTEDAGVTTTTAAHVTTTPSTTRETRVVSNTTTGAVNLSQSDAATEVTSLDSDASVDVTSLEQETSVPDAALEPEAGAPELALPPPNGGLDYQLGGGYALPEGVTIVSRDRTDTTVPGAYNICYVNGYQVQPGEEDDWDADLLLRDDNGDLVIDEDWDEVMLDISTADKRERIAAVVGAWIAACATDGFQAVEIDNLDTYTRSDNRIDEDDAVDFIARLAVVAHQSGLAIAQKNSVELVPRRAEMGTDFVVSEECNAWEECDGYIEAYGQHVLMIEYGSDDFERGCDLYGDEFSVVLRDRELRTPASDAYVFDGC